MMFIHYPNIHRIFKRLAKALIRLPVCASWSEPLLVATNHIVENPMSWLKFYPVAKELIISTWLNSLQIDLQDIKERFESKYEKSLYDVVKDECSGHFMRLLLCIINGSYVEPE